MYAMKLYMATVAQLNVFFNLTLDGVECLAPCPGCLTIGNQTQ
jgi:hypothetical protein